MLKGYLASMGSGLLYKEECFNIVGLCMKIHSILGPGFKEVVYKDALEIELNNNKILHQREKSFSIIYKEAILKHRFSADFVINNSIILEIKAASNIHYEYFRQTLNYLKVSEIKLGILINFGASKLEFQRIIYTN